MTLPTCPHEPAVIHASMAAAWPEGADPALVAHARTCAVCREAVLVATLMQAADGAADAEVPTAAQMWWRLAVRARLERERAAARPVVWLEGLAGACGLGLVAAAAGVLQPWLAAAGSGVTSRAARLVPDVTAAWVVADGAAAGAASPYGVFALAAGGLLLVTAATAAIYLWVADE